MAEQRIYWHRILQDILDKHLELMSGKEVLERDREFSTHFRVDYFCRCGDALTAVVDGVYPFDHLRGYNVIEYKSIHETLSEQVFRSYIGKTLLIEDRYRAQGDTTLTIVLSRVPRKLLMRAAYGFLEITPWKYRSSVFHDLEVTILIQSRTRGIEGGEPLAFLQALEGDPRYQKKTLEGIMAQEFGQSEALEDIIMRVSGGAFMSIISEAIEKAKPSIIAKAKPEIIAKAKPEIIAKAEPEIIARAKPSILAEGEQKSLRNTLRMILASRAELRERYGKALAAAETLGELQRLQKEIVRNMFD